MLNTVVEIVNAVIITALIICFSYQAIFLFAPYVKKLREKMREKMRDKRFLFSAKTGPGDRNGAGIGIPAGAGADVTMAIEKQHRYGVLIAARNEEPVIANLIGSIKKQTYDEKKVDVFVVADNCTDQTAPKARMAGAEVYERFNKVQVGKGYALKYLLDQLMAKENWSEYDGFFIFDADNILEENYIEEMNHIFNQGYPVVTSYRNSTNFGDNWISAGYAIWFLHEAQWLNRGRMAAGSSCMVQGTGYVVARELLERNDGWRFFCLTEDIEFTADCIVNDIKIGYCEKAMFYDEQPTRFKDSWNQRIRWIKGYFQVFKKYKGKLAKGVLKKRSLSCYDVLMAQLPAFVVTAGASAVSIVLLIIGLITAQDVTCVLFTVGEFLVKIYAAMFLLGIYTVVTEWKHIHMTAAKKIGYIFTFPLYMYTYVPISFAALKKKVEWKPIAHKATSMEQIKTGSAEIPHTKTKPPKTFYKYLNLNKI